MQALLILGMHRSYTSLVARWLGECGLSLGGELLADGVGNRDGHFEDIAFLELHRKALQQAGLQANGMVEIRQPVFDKAGYEGLKFEGDLREEAGALIGKRAATGKPFGWKEPRTCLFLPFYREQLDCRSIILFRDYNQVVGSLLSREGPAIRDFYYAGLKRPIYWFKKASLERQVQALKDGFLDAWIYYNSCLLDHIETEGADRVLIHDLDSLAAHSDDAIARIKDWGAPIENIPFADFVGPLSDYSELQVDSNRRARADAITARFRALIAGG